jgi:hypothetical protein
VINDLHFIGIKKDNDDTMFKKEGTGLKWHEKSEDRQSSVL